LVHPGAEIPWFGIGFNNGWNFIFHLVNLGFPYQKPQIPTIPGFFLIPLDSPKRRKPFGFERGKLKPGLERKGISTIGVPFPGQGKLGFGPQSLDNWTFGLKFFPFKSLDPIFALMEVSLNQILEI